MSGADKLVMMANQITRNLEARGEDEAVAETAAHIAKFWDPHMRADILAHVDAGAEGLSPLTLKALDRLKQS